MIYLGGHSSDPLLGLICDVQHHPLRGEQRHLLRDLVILRLRQDACNRCIRMHMQIQIDSDLDTEGDGSASHKMILN